MDPADRDQLIPVPAERCAKNCTYFTSCFKHRGYSQPHVCVPLAGTDATAYLVLLAMAALVLALIIDVFLFCVGTFVAKK
ncbi:hypothetical protein AAVH_18852 [Aphelenchoides avenae]|nr:hypothetical protein AAVH_18852 [Aphelenchus avenae]